MWRGARRAVDITSKLAGILDAQRLLGSFKQAWLESGGVHDDCKLTLDMRDWGEPCGRHRMARLLSRAGLKVPRGHRERHRMLGGVPADVAGATVQRECERQV